MKKLIANILIAVYCLVWGTILVWASVITAMERDWDTFLTTVIMSALMIFCPIRYWWQSAHDKSRCTYRYQLPDGEWEEMLVEIEPKD